MRPQESNQAIERVRRSRTRRQKRRFVLKLLATLMTVTLMLTAGALVLGLMYLDRGLETVQEESWSPNIVNVPEGWEDWEPPVITGVQELTVVVGSNVSYKRNVTATDNQDGEVELTVDTGSVDLNTVGDYPIIYRAKDKAGNRTEVVTTIHVVMEDGSTGGLVDAEADQLLEELGIQDMTPYEAARAIYDWVHSQIAYVDSGVRDNGITGAYQGLVERKGDCYTYASTAQCLLSRAGIENQMIEKIPSETEHYWNLINLGDGWYHFDATRRSDGSTFFYVTNAELMAYSDAHNNSHRYNPENYPQIQ